MNESDRTLLATNRSTPPSKVEDVGGLQSEQHMTPSPRMYGLLVVKGLEEKFHYSQQYHWTVRRKTVTMTQKTASILLKVWIVRCLLDGVGLSDYLGLEYLTSYVLGGKTDPLDIRDEKDRQAVLLGFLFIASVKGEWLNLEDKSKIPPSIAQEIIATGWLPTKRTFYSWKVYHEPWRYLEVLAVPLDYYDERDNSTTRYTSYTKHYGNGGHISRTKKTPYDFELDGETAEREPPEFNLQEIEQYNHILLSIEREKLANRFSEK
jgi:hypothetical protein